MGSILFDASAERLSRDSTFISATTYTVMCWVYPVTASGLNETYIFRGDGANDGGHCLQRNSNGTPGFRTDGLPGNNGASGSTAMAQNAWRHIAGTFNSGTAEVFLDGVSEGSGTMDAVPASDQHLWIGGNAFSTDRQANARIAAVKIWSRVLSAAEIAIERQFYFPVFRSNLVYFNPLFETGNAALGDYSGSGNTTSANGTPTNADGPPIGLFFDAFDEDPYIVSAGGSSFNVSDSGSGSESLSVVASLPLSESSAGADTPSLAAGISVSDTAAGSDSPSGSASPPVSDSGSGSDGVNLAANLQISETVSAIEALALVASLSVTDTGAGSDVPSASEEGDKSVSDSGSGSDGVSVAVSLPLTEPASGVETLSLMAAIALSEAAAGSELVSSGAQIQVADVSIGSEGLTISVSIAVSDLGSGVESFILDTGVIFKIIRLASVALKGPKFTDVQLSVPGLSVVTLTK